MFITKDPTTGKHVLNRIITVWGVVVLSVVILKEAWMRSLQPLDYIAFAVACVILYAPPYGIKLLEAYKGTKVNGDKDAGNVNS